MTRAIQTLIQTLTLCLLCLPVLSLMAANNGPIYHLEFSESLDKVQVKIELSETENNLRARDAYSSIFIQAPRDCESNETLNYRNSRISILPTTRCIEYSAHLNQKQERRPFGQKYKTLVTTPSEWLFLPPLSQSESVTLLVSKPAAMNFSTPWENIESDNLTFHLSASPQSADGVLVIGDFEQRNIQHQGTSLRVAYLPGASTDYDNIDAWLKASVDNVSQTYGRFPHPNPQIIISPIAQAWSYYKSPVPYGRVVRDYGESVQFYIDQRQSLKQFKADWTATHEFAHLMLPYISWKNRWLSEGFASYYQNILMARAGEYSEQKAWQKLYDGFRRGEASAPELSPNSAAREGHGANMKVYWSGAALALLADVRLREQSNGQKSLDTTLDALQECCLPSGRQWNGSQLMRKLDQLSESKVFSELYKSYANEPGFFPYQEAFDALGIEIKRNRIQLKTDAVKKVAIRKKITEQS